MNSIPSIEKQFNNGLDSFEKRVKGSGLIIWPRVLRNKLVELSSAHEEKNKAVCTELESIESIVMQIAKKRAKEFPATEDQENPKDESVLLLNKIYKLKGIVGLICFGVIAFTMLPGIHAVRRPNSGRMKIEEMEMEAQEWTS